MKTIAHCLDLNEALRLKMELAAAGIPSFIPDEVSASLVPPLFLGSSGVRVQVAEEHVEAAEQVIKEGREPS